MAREQGEQVDWTEVTGRSVAFLALQAEGLNEASISEKGEFLVRRLGIPQRDAAEMLGSSAESLRKLLGRRKVKSA